VRVRGAEAAGAPPRGERRHHPGRAGGETGGSGHILSRSLADYGKNFA
jgi:hypothetical protein